MTSVDAGDGLTSVEVLGIVVAAVVLCGLLCVCCCCCCCGQTMGVMGAAALVGGVVGGASARAGGRRKQDYVSVNNAGLPDPGGYQTQQPQAEQQQHPFAQGGAGAVAVPWATDVQTAPTGAVPQSAVPAIGITPTAPMEGIASGGDERTSLKAGMATSGSKVATTGMGGRGTGFREGTGYGATGGAGNSNSGSSSGGNILAPQEPQFRDVWAAVLFMVQFVLIAWLATQASFAELNLMEGIGDDSSGSGGDASSSSSDWVATEGFKAALIACAIAAAVSTVLSVLWVGYMVYHAEGLIQTSLVVSVVISVLAAAGCALIGQLAGLIVFGIFAIVTILYACAIQDRIEFCAAIQSVACSAITTHACPLFMTSVIGILAQVAWCLIWTMAALGAYQSIRSTIGDDDDDDDGDDDKLRGAPKAVPVIVLCFMLLSFYWTAQVVANTVHMTIAGTVGSWYFCPNTYDSPVSAAARRATTYSFGSVCFASLVVAFIELCRWIVESARESAREEGRTGAGLVLCCLDCLLGWIEQLVQYFNQWALCYVALYNDSYLEAGKEVMELFALRGWEGIVAEDLTARVIFYGEFVVAAATCCVGLVIASLFPSTFDSLNQPMLWVGGAGFLVGFVVACVALRMIDSAVCTIYVCFAKDPDVLRLNYPTAHSTIWSAWSVQYAHVLPVNAHAYP